MFNAFYELELPELEDQHILKDELIYLDSVAAIRKCGKIVNLHSPNKLPFVGTDKKNYCFQDKRFFNICKKNKNLFVFLPKPRLCLQSNQQKIKKNRPL